MSYFIIIRGPLGVGKTTVAKALAQRLDGTYISIDGVLAEHNLDIVEEECIPLRNFVKVNNLTRPASQAALDAGRVVVFDGNFYHQQQIEHLQETLKGPSYVFTLKAPLEVCIARDSQRERVYGEGAAAAVHYLVSRFEYGINIDTEGKTLDDVLEAIDAHLP